MSRNKKFTTRRLAVAVVTLVLGLIAQRAGFDLSTLSFDSTAPAPRANNNDNANPTTHRDRPRNQPTRLDRASRIERAIANRESGIMTTVEARVIKTLPDDLDGSRHQRFLIEISTGESLLVAHNIDLAERVPISTGDHIEIHGQYEWNDRGGVLHWTHRDPQGRHEDGWIFHDGIRTN